LPHPRVIRRLAVLAVCLSAVVLTARPVTAAGAAALPVSTEGRLADVRVQHQLWGTVVDVGPGPYVAVRTPERHLAVRLAGVELPEAAPDEVADGVEQPFGDEAAAYLRALLLGKQVLLEPYGKDRRGRLRAVVYLGEINVNLTLVKEGLAWVSPRTASPRVRAPLQVAERQAQVARYGLWSLPDPEPPWKFRKRHGLRGE
jgi:endonuclease YncB( thermonuclease family)